MLLLIERLVVCLGTFWAKKNAMKSVVDCLRLLYYGGYKSVCYQDGI
jgi:hypothetical protein